MSFIDDIIDFAGGALDWYTGDSVGAQLARTATLGYVLNQTNKSVNKENSTPAATRTPEPDRGVRLQINPDPNAKIPVVYGTAHLGGIITDAVLTNSNKTMWFCITICEKTGLTNIGRGAASEFIFEDIWYNDNRIVFKADGRTANYMVDKDSNIDYSIQDLVSIYCFAGNSTTPVLPDNYSSGGLVNAYTLMPNWTSSHSMTDLVFALIKIDYNREKGVVGIPDIRFQITNTMNQPGDCLFDYMTNTRYGAGIDPAEIYGYE